MSNAYTSPVAEGKVSDLKTFIMKCAGAFTPDGEVRDVYRYTEKHQIGALSARVAYFAGMSDREAANESERAAVEALSRHADKVHLAAEEAKNLRAMLEKVEEWVPPTDEHGAIKRFAREQIEAALKLVTGTNEWPLPACVFGNEWREDMLQKAMNDLEDARYGRAKALKYAIDMNVWAMNLRRSLEPQPAWCGVDMAAGGEHFMTPADKAKRMGDMLSCVGRNDEDGA